MPRAPRARITANFERNLEEIREFLSGVGGEKAFFALLERLENRVIPTLERFPSIGADFLARAPLSAKGVALFEAVVEAAGGGEIRQWIEGDYIVLYLVDGASITLLSIRHHRQLSFDLRGHWP
jgi:hypothetical protein